MFKKNKIYRPFGTVWFSLLLKPLSSEPNGSSQQHKVTLLMSIRRRIRISFKKLFKSRDQKPKLILPKNQKTMRTLQLRKKKPRSAVPKCARKCWSSSGRK